VDNLIQMRMHASSTKKAAKLSMLVVSGGDAA
jgi:hypothetical protein